MGKSSLEVFVIATMLVVVVASNYLIQSSEAQTSHVVGSTKEWIIPPGGASDYTSWAANQTFAVGDILVFNYTTGEHDVAEVTQAAFNACTSTNTIFISKTGPTNITLSTGEHFYICTFGTHCSLGQKLAITVSANATSTPPPPATTAVPPPPSKSSPLVTALPVTLLSIAITLLL